MGKMVFSNDKSPTVLTVNDLSLTDMLKENNVTLHIDKDRHIDAIDTMLQVSLPISGIGKNANNTTYNLNNCKTNLVVPNTSLRIVDIKESTEDKTVKIPQEKSAPIIQTYTYKVVTVKFSNGSTQKASCLIQIDGKEYEEDKYDLARGVEVCVMKQLLGSAKKYNKFLSDAEKKFKKDLRIEAENKKRIEEAKAIQDKHYAKVQAKKAKLQAKIAQAEKEKQIEIQSEAIIRAIKALKTCHNIDIDAKTVSELCFEK